MSERFYINWPLAPGVVELSGPEAHHLATVCRLRAGDELRLFNGDGSEYPARVVAAGRRSVSLEVLGGERAERELPFVLELAAPLPKGDRAQFLVEKLTELGVTTFAPLNCVRSVMLPSEGKLEKLARYVIEASKQCGRNVLMKVAEPASWEEYCRRRDAEIRLLAHPGGGKGFPSSLRGKSYRCAVGPEGGFTDDEIRLAMDAGWQFVDLGPRVLRVETAAIVIAALASTW